MTPTRPVSARYASVFHLLAVFVFSLLTPGVAAAQDSGKVGLVASTGPDVGVIWNITERIAILPTIGFTYLSTSSRLFNLEPLERDDSLNVALHLAAQLTLAEPGAFRLFVSPSYGKTWSTAGTLVSESNYTLGGAFGARYALNDRFSLFGETGILYRNTALEPVIPDAPFDIDLGRTTIWGVGSASRLASSSTSDASAITWTTRWRSSSRRFHPSNAFLHERFVQSAQCWLPQVLRRQPAAAEQER